MNFAYLNQSTYQISVLAENFDFLDQVYLKRVSRENWTKSERHEFLIFEISRCQTSASRIKVASRGFPSQKQKKWTKQNTKLSMFKLVLVPNFSLNWQFWFFGSNLRKEGISSWKQKKIYPTIKCCILK